MLAQIKNFNGLATNSDKKNALLILEKGLATATPDVALQKIIKKNKLVLNSDIIFLSKYKRIFVIGLGKAADLMAQSISSKINVNGGIIVIPQNTNSMFKNKNFEILHAGHPLPNMQSLYAAKKIIKLLRQRKKTDFVMFLISGGSSSLVALPDGISLYEKKLVTNLLLKAGADIHEINCVRKHLSKIKGGQITKNLFCDAVALVMSDVVGNDLSSIASGLTYYDKTTFRDAKNILKKYKIQKIVPRRVLKRIKFGVSGKMPETPKRAKIKNYIVAENKDCLYAMAKKAKNLGLKTKVIYPITGDVKQAAKKLVRSMPKKPNSCIIFGGETTVKVLGKGKGGRNQELVLHALQEIHKTNENLTIASIGTDGKDGNTDAAGAIASNAEFIPKKIQNFLQNNDSYNFFKKYGGLIFTGPTHTNLMDIGIILRR